MNSTQPQRDFIASLLGRIGVEVAFKAGAITADMAIDQGIKGGFRSPREVAQHNRSKTVASKTITALKAIA